MQYFIDVYYKIAIYTDRRFLSCKKCDHTNLVFHLTILFEYLFTCISYTHTIYMCICFKMTELYW